MPHHHNPGKFKLGILRHSLSSRIEDVGQGRERGGEEPVESCEEPVSCRNDERPVSCRNDESCEEQVRLRDEVEQVSYSDTSSEYPDSETREHRDASYPDSETREHSDPFTPQHPDASTRNLKAAPGRVSFIE